MKDPSTEILKAFYDALNGNLSFGGDNYPVYTVAPKSGSYNYVLLDDVTLLDDSAKDYFDTEGTILMDIVTADSADGGTLIPVNDIANDILLLVVRKGLSMTNFTLAVRPFLDFTHIIKEQTETALIIRKLITLRFWTTQN